MQNSIVPLSVREYHNDLHNALHASPHAKQSFYVVDTRKESETFAEYIVRFADARLFGYEDSIEHELRRKGQ